MSFLLPDRIQARLDAEKLTALSASIKAGLGRTAISDILSGKSKRPQIDTVAAIARALKCSIQYLVGDIDTPFPADGGLKAYYVDFRFEQLSAELEVGVFRDQGRKLQTEEYPVYDHPDFLSWAVSLYRQNDDTMAAFGVFKGDFITAALPAYDTDLPLVDGRMVVIRRFIDDGKGKSYVEHSLRLVERIDAERVRLTTKPLNADPSEIVIEESRAPDQLSNTYWTDDGSIWIDGLVVRVSRDFPGGVSFG